MKIVRRTTCLLVLAAAGAAAMPAQAAGPYALKGGAGGGAFSSGSLLLKGAKGPACSAEVASHPAQGIDSLILDGRPYANRTTNLDWSAEVDLGYLDVTFFDAACNVTFTPGATQSFDKPGRATFKPPANTRWLVVSSGHTYDVTFSINAV